MDALRRVKRRFLRSDLHFALEIWRRRLLIGLRFRHQRTVRGVVLSLTTVPSRARKLHLVLGSVQTQSVLPERIVLYLGADEFLKDHPTAAISRLRVETRYVAPGLKSYKKLVPALADFPGMAIVTCDDDLFFPQGWFAALAAAAAESPGVIACMRARQVVDAGAGSFAPYSEWPEAVGTQPTFWIAPLGGCGTWYPPDSLDERVTASDLFSRLAPHADDLWFRAMSWLRGTPARNVGLFSSLPELTFAGGPRLWDLNRNGGNDRQLLMIAGHFGTTPKYVERLEASLRNAPAPPA